MQQPLKLNRLLPNLLIAISYASWVENARAYQYKTQFLFKGAARARTVFVEIICNLKFITASLVQF